MSDDVKRSAQRIAEAAGKACIKAAKRAKHSLQPGRSWAEIPLCQGPLPGRAEAAELTGEEDGEKQPPIPSMQGGNGEASGFHRAAQGGGAVAADTGDGQIVRAAQNVVGGQIQDQSPAGFEDAEKSGERGSFVHAFVIEHIQTDDDISTGIRKWQLIDAALPDAAKPPRPRRRHGGRGKVDAGEPGQWEGIAQTLQHATGAAARIENSTVRLRRDQRLEVADYHIPQCAIPPMPVFDLAHGVVFVVQHSDTSGPDRVKQEGADRWGPVKREFPGV